MNTKKILKSLEDPKTALAAVIVVVVFVFVSVWLFRKVKSLWSGSTLQGVWDDARIQSSTGTLITQSTDFGRLAQRMWEATCGGGDFWAFGTDEAEVYAVLQSLNTQADYMKLCTAWESLVASAPWWKKNLTFAGVQSRSTLQSLLHAELNSSELEHAREILRAKGITPDF